MKKLNRGLWGDFIQGIFVLAAVTMMYIILQQTYEYNIKPHGVDKGADTVNASYIDMAWDFWPIPVVMAFFFMIIKTGNQNKVGGNLIE